MLASLQPCKRLREGLPKFLQTLQFHLPNFQSPLQPERLWKEPVPEAASWAGEGLILRPGSQERGQGRQFPEEPGVCFFPWTLRLSRLPCSSRVDAHPAPQAGFCALLQRSWGKLSISHCLDASEGSSWQKLQHLASLLFPSLVSLWVMQAHHVGGGSTSMLTSGPAIGVPHTASWAYPGHPGRVGRTEAGKLHAGSPPPLPKPSAVPVSR